MSLLELLIAATAAGAITALLVPVVSRWAVRRRIVAIPNERSSHSRATPVGGGLPIVACVLVGVALLRDPADPLAAWWSSYLAGAIFVAAISWWDDVYGAPPGARLAVHVAAALLVLLPLREALAPTPSLALLAVGLVWIVGLCNAYNFMDGIDGIAAAQAIVAGAGWAWLGWRGGDAMTALAGALIAGASLGFLFFNWPPAKVFMGDAGAAFLGFTFAALTVLALTQSLERAAAGALFVWPFLFDTTFTLVRRLVRGENVFRAHRSHLYQRLVARGWSHARVTALYAALAILGVVVGG